MLTSRQSIKGSTIYYSLAGLITLMAVAYGLLQFRVVQDQTMALGDNESVIAALTAKNQKLNQYYKHFAATEEPLQAQLTKSLEEILPGDENYTDLTRLFDEFFAQHDSATNPIFQSSLRFNKGVPVANMPGISVLPVTMNIEGTRENFFAFLDFINASGVITTRTRLIAVTSIQLNFPDGGEVLDNKHQVLNFTVDMMAYYRTPRK